MSTTSSPTSPRRSRSDSCTTPSGSDAPLPVGVLGGGHAEQDHRAHAERGEVLDLGPQRVAGVLHDARQRRDRLGFV